MPCSGLRVYIWLQGEALSVSGDSEAEGGQAGSRSGVT